jgi:hypothetical protein
VSRGRQRTKLRFHACRCGAPMSRPGVPRWFRVAVHKYKYRARMIMAFLVPYYKPTLHICAHCQHINLTEGRPGKHY